MNKGGGRELVNCFIPFCLSYACTSHNLSPLDISMFNVWLILWATAFGTLCDSKCYVMTEDS